MICTVKVIMTEKAKWKRLDIPTPAKRVNKKPSQSGTFAETNTDYTYFKYVGIAVPTTFSLIAC